MSLRSNNTSSAISLPKSRAGLFIYLLGFKEQEACKGRKALVVPMKSAIAHSQPNLIPFSQLQYCMVAGCIWLPFCFIAVKKKRHQLLSLCNGKSPLHQNMSSPSPPDSHTLRVLWLSSLNGMWAEMTCTTYRIGQHNSPKHLCLLLPHYHHVEW